LTIPVGGAVNCHLNPAFLRCHGGVLVVRGDIKIMGGRLTTMDVLEVPSVKHLAAVMVLAFTH
jgi:hypothetical protein